MIELPLASTTEPTTPSPRRPVRAFLLHLLRIAMFVVTLVMVRIQYQRQLDDETGDRSPSIALESVTAIFPDAAKISHSESGRSAQAVRDEDDNPLGYVIQTSPQSDDIIGFSGPTNVLIAFDEDDRVVGTRVLWSRDTREHLDMVLEDGRLLSAWNGLTWDELANQLSSGSAAVDAVSGATLTSLAIVESAGLRLTGERPTSLRFPEPLEVEEVSQFFPDVEWLVEPDGARLTAVLGKDGNTLGQVLRTSPAAENITGYQGPTDTLIALDRDNRVLGIRLRQSFDNEPYVGYVRDEDYFLTLFNGQTLEELSKLDLFEAQVEGVSGATMTSMAVADGLVAAAGQAVSARSERKTVVTAREPRINVTWRTIATTVIVAAGIAVGRFRRGLSRRLFQLAVIGLIGVVNGDLVSQAVLIGWSQSGVPWRLAPGLVVITAAALLVPMVSRRQPYCQHLCPHGAVQQLLIRRIRWQWKLPRRLHGFLLLIPFVLLVAVVVIAMTGLPVSVVNLEPFDAWVIGLAGIAAATIAIVGLIASLFVPMAYCRYGCPTGALLQFLRFHSRSDRLTCHDAAAGIVAALSIGFVVATG